MDAFLCVHAGMDPQKSLMDQSNGDLFWIRNKFIYSSHSFPYTVLFGHTPQRAVLFDLPYKVGLDTGLVYGNKLTCLELDEKVLLQISRGKRAYLELQLNEIGVHQRHQSDRLIFFQVINLPARLAV